MSAITQSHNDYLVTVKRNQPRLFTACQAIIESRPATDCDDRCQRGHGRHERRIVSLWDAPVSGDPLAIDKSWSRVRCIVRVERLRQVASDAPSSETTYYISSRAIDSAYQMAEMIRGHWGIENGLHRVKDVQQNEDANRITGTNAAGNISLLKTWVLSLFRLAGHTSIKNASIRFANKIPALMALMRT